MTQVTSENTQVTAKDAVQEKSTNGIFSRIGKYKQATTIALFVLLLIVVVFLLVRMNSLGNRLAALQAPSAAVQVDSSKTEADSAAQAVNQEPSAKVIEAAKYRAIALKFAALNTRAAQLRFSQAENVATSKPSDVAQKKNIQVPVNSEMKWWGAVGDKVLAPIGNFFKDLVKIQVIDDPDMKGAASGIAIGPIAQSLVRQQVLSYLLSARQFVLLEMPKEALGDLQEVRLIIVKNFASQNADTLAFIDGLNQIETDLKVLSLNAASTKPAEKK